ncbi:aldehyde dehydrogenase family protein [Vitreoscilla massiliensis]|uniref:Aldehyde dehydrogenase family protein n=1 Tax=Vitreoscilla massiliensis TaxID=1689272 RepID=A0ABY4DWE3_9NEIS|nr:aldehyde dehydrogenase family protein [Vitreoscilla massiliensis]UOO87833.1 aldehyde dehydrogenase family protein [Vitreoscilla massiliensis]
MGLLNKLWQQWHQTQDEADAVPIMADEDFHYAPHFIAGVRLIVESNQVLEVVNPRNSRAERRLYVASAATIQRAVQTAKEHRAEWAAFAYLQRLYVIEKFKNSFALQAHILNEVLQGESGLNEAEVATEIEQTLEAIVYALTAMQAKGSSTPAWGSTDVWVQHAMQPVGVAAIISNEEQTLKSLVSEIVVALLCGNTLIVKPYPSQPLLPVLLGDWLAQSGLPAGVYNVIQGDDEVAKALHVHPDVNAITYVLAKPQAKQAHLRQRQTILAHNFIVIDADMDVDKVWQQYVSCSAPRLSVPVWIVVGQDNADALLAKWQTRLATLAPMVLPTEHSKQLCSEFLQRAVSAGADLVVDGSQSDLPEKGWYMGMSLLDQVQPEMALHTAAPSRVAVMLMRVPDLDAALGIINATPNVGAASLFTESMTSMGVFKQNLQQVEVISFNRVESVSSLNLPRGDISHQWAVGGQHAARWHFYIRHQLIMGTAI